MQPAVQPQQQLFRNRFIVAKDFLIRIPLDAGRQVREFVLLSHLAGCVQLGVEAFRPLDSVHWSGSALRMLMEGNAGGSSLISEVLAFEMLARAFGAHLEKTEKELAYRPGSKITDFAIQAFGENVPLGVSVTRAYSWGGPPTEEEERPWDRRCRGRPVALTPCAARRLLEKKLFAVNSSSRNVRNYRWRKQILFVWAFSYADACLLEEEYLRISTKLRANTVLLISRVSGVEWIW